MTVLPFERPADVEASAVAAARHMQSGGLVAYPTETVYGLGCALEPDALATLARLKRRDRERPFLVLVARPDMVPGLRWTSDAGVLARTFWPGPLTLVLDADAELPPEIRGADGGVAVRVSPHAGVAALIHALGGPITSTSANEPGLPPAQEAAAAIDVVRALGPDQGWLVLDGGTLAPSPSSTVVRCSGARTAVLRAGAVPVEDLRAVVKEIHA